MAPLELLSLLVLIPQTTVAFKGFQPNCTLPSHAIGYATSPQVRGTLTIVWSCFAVIILCTWSVQHLHVPQDTDKEKPSSYARRFARAAISLVFRQKKKVELWDEFLDEVRWNYERLKWMAFIILVPEFYFAKALTENCAANDSRKGFGDERWGTMHAFHANNRGFVLRFETTAVKTSLHPLKADEDGRALYVPRPDGFPTTYFEQDTDHAEQIEIRHCQQKCGSQCSHRTDGKSGEGKKLRSRPSILRADSELADQQPNVERRQVLKGDQRPQVSRIQTTHLLSNPASPLLDTSTTLVNSPRSSSRSTNEIQTTSTMSLVNHSQVTPYPSQDTIELPNVRSRPPPKTSQQSQETLSPESPLLRASPRTSLDSSVGTKTRKPPAKPKLGVRNEEADALLSPQLSEKPQIFPHKPWPGTMSLNTHQLEYAYSIRLIGPPPYIDSATLKNQSKTDPLAKALTIWQILWLVIQIMARAFQSPPLATTLLEVTVLAFAACAILIYILLWHKPQDVKVPTYIDALRPITRADVIGLAARAPLSTMFAYEFWLHGVAVRTMGDSIFPFTRGFKAPHFPRLGRMFSSRRNLHSPPNEGKPPPTANSNGMPHRQDVYLNPIPLGLSLGGAIFGSIHFVAWNFEFPTPIERLLWRISCSVLVGLPLLMTTIYSGYMHYTKVTFREKREDGKVNATLRRCGHVFVPLYLAARGYLMVEVFRSLSRSEPDIFQEVNWPSAIPHYS